MLGGPGQGPARPPAPSRSGEKAEDQPDHPPFREKNLGGTASSTSPVRKMKAARFPGWAKCQGL